MKKIVVIAGVVSSLFSMGAAGADPTAPPEITAQPGAPAPAPIPALPVTPAPEATPAPPVTPAPEAAPALPVTPVLPATSDSRISGIWAGSLAVGGGIALRLVAKIGMGPDGKLSSTLDSLDQGAMGIPVQTTTFQDDRLDLVVAAVQGEYKATLSGDGKTLTGTWTQGGMSFPLVMTKTEKEEELTRHPQEPKPPFPYVSEDVTFPNKSAGITLAGTLTKPLGPGPFPVVALITGSGPQNRNEEILGHKPFWVIADYLTRRGIAVLRTDDRGVAKSTGDFAAATSFDFAGDTLAAVAYLKSRRDIDRKHIGLIGHSEGGLIAPICATRSRDVAFIVLMAGPGLPGDQILERQGALIESAAGIPAARIAKNEEAQKQALQIVRAEPDLKRREEKLRSALSKVVETQDSRQELARTNGGKPMTSQQISDFVGRQVAMLASPWMRTFILYDPRPTLKKVKCPVLAIDGSRDLQVPPKDDLDAIQDALKAGGNRDVTVRELPGLNHLFQPTKTGSPSEYAAIETTVDPSALQVMGDWIVRHVK